MPLPAAPQAVMDRNHHCRNATAPDASPHQDEVDGSRQVSWLTLQRLSNLPGKTFPVASCRQPRRSQLRGQLWQGSICDPSTFPLSPENKVLLACIQRTQNILETRFNRPAGQSDSLPGHRNCQDRRTQSGFPPDRQPRYPAAVLICFSKSDATSTVPLASVIRRAS